MTAGPNQPHGQLGAAVLANDLKPSAKRFMRTVNQTTVSSEIRKSPKGSFEVIRSHMAVALGGTRNIGPWGGGHTFEVDVARTPAQKKGYPYRAHDAQTEY